MCTLNLASVALRTRCVASLTSLKKLRLTKPCTEIQMSQSLSSSSRSRPKQEYLIVIPDFPGKQVQRAEAQPKHIEGATPLIESGKLSYFGVTLAEHVKPDAACAPDIVGSAIVLEAESERAVRDFLEMDAYSKAGVWNVKEAQIWPFRSG